MKLKTITVEQYLRKNYKINPIESSLFEQFKKELEKFIERINTAEKNNQTETTQTPHLITFLRNTFYSKNHVNPKDYKGQSGADLVIGSSKSQESNVEILFEVKRINNPEMIERKNINKKSLQEIILYYLYEKMQEKNNEIKNLIVTNFENWYVFDAYEIRKFFFTSELKEKFKKWFSKETDDPTTSQMHDIISDYIKSKSSSSISATYFNLFAVQNDETQLKFLYKFLKDNNLLQRKNENRHSLNKDFYFELLHIIGVKEKKGGGNFIEK